jgi:polyhydroxyalkanoate synthesis regulator phasin
MSKVALRIGLALAAAALVLPMMAKSAKPSTDAKAKSTTLNIYQAVKFGDTMVKPGSYKLVIENGKATVEDGKKVIATANGKWEERNQKADATGFETTNGEVNDVFIHGDTSVFVLNQS